MIRNLLLPLTVAALLLGAAPLIADFRQAPIAHHDSLIDSLIDLLDGQQKTDSMLFDRIEQLESRIRTLEEKP